jgi:hypothetical protein
VRRGGGGGCRATYGQISAKGNIATASTVHLSNKRKRVHHWLNQRPVRINRNGSKRLNLRIRIEAKRQFRVPVGDGVVEQAALSTLMGGR